MNKIQVIGFNNLTLLNIQILSINKKTYAKITTIENNRPHWVFDLYFYIKITRFFRTIYEYSIYGTVPIENNERYIRIYNNTTFKLFHAEPLGRLLIYDKNGELLFPINVIYIWNLDSLKIVDYAILTLNNIYNLFLYFVIFIMFIIYYLYIYINNRKDVLKKNNIH
ncbi:hypothetical protein AMVITR10b [Betaentomopoxvirus amoorei]|uniref:AMVITR10 n=1 Tax=Amsacta moorei entomopoxvirus TaxID=28321 RepID=Q9DGT4_AMEPV|nr:hypothetical protein AMVITR10a [Amsacta moorei entomopoxvirus]NP_065052.1 hypothetical protein AMVITR10b [Amsacta moorei entomopoxvirus]AAG02982.1 AMVITR10 [Amsacta moorei entomopoxvirus]AAG02994.1 AMVITR10 [Amsacta moorei entomopoxvirus]